MMNPPVKAAREEGLAINQISQLSDRICTELLHELKEGVYRDAVKLPPEVEIAAALGVSRTVLRDALAALEREGFISRKHGVGTIVNRHVLAVRTRMDLEEEFLSMIATAGKKPRQKWARVAFCPAPEETAACLGLESGAPVVQVSRLILADGVPAIYCIDRFAQRLISAESYDVRVLQEPIFNFLKAFCGTDVYMDLTEVMAISASEELAGYLDLPVGAPVLHMNEVGYDFRGRPVLSSLEYYRNGALHHTVLRKKI
jgi:GntR family transcriptional regulator